MYSLVLATMLTAGGEAPNWGCWGCHGGCYGCYGCHGCWGGGFGIGIGIGWGHGCWGCYGCHGCWGCYGCSGCWGCCGGCYGCSGCWGGYYPAYDYSWSYGCCGGCCGGCYGGYVLPGGAPGGSGPVKGSEVSYRGTVTVHLPADAKLYVDGQFANLSSSTRTFSTPDLEKGREYYYTIKAEWSRDGKVVSDSQRVTVKAGQVSNVEFKDATVTSVKDVPPLAKDSPAKVTVKLPADAKLYIDGQLCPLTSDVRTFSTPTLNAGKTYYYTLEIVRNGDKKSDTRKVSLEAGKAVEVDFNKTVVVEANN